MSVSVEDMCGMSKLPSYMSVVHIHPPDVTNVTHLFPL